MPDVLSDPPIRLTVAVTPAQYDYLFGKKTPAERNVARINRFWREWEMRMAPYRPGWARCRVPE